MIHTTALYRAAANAAVHLAPVVVRGTRAAHAHRARLAAAAAMTKWARRNRDPARPLAWFHAPSVGEGLQARAVIEAFRRTHPDAQVVFTHFSPSAEQLAARMPVDYHGYLPYDRRRDVDVALDALNPSVMVFTKLDLWPELATRAHARGAAVAMVAATVLADSGRLKWPQRTQLRPGYAVLDAVGAVSSSDSTRLQRLGVNPANITVTGDPRVDSVLAAADAIDPADPVARLMESRDTLVAGSTWPADEDVLIDAFVRIHAQIARARLVIVPHQPHEGHLARLENRIRNAGLRSVRLSAVTSERGEEIVIVDRVGILATLYATGEIAYVGGGWGSAGIHSVLEPAALGRIVIIGPADRGSTDARLLDEAGALIRLPRTGAGDALASRWRDLLESDSARNGPGERARAALERARGASLQSVAVIERALHARR